MDSDERKQKVETMKALIKAECLRTMELLDTKQDITYPFYCGTTARSELKSKMRELRKDTIRLDHLMYGGYTIEE